MKLCWNMLHVQKLLRKKTVMMIKWWYWLEETWMIKLESGVAWREVNSREQIDGGRIACDAWPQCLVRDTFFKLSQTFKLEDWSTGHGSLRQSGASLLKGSINRKERGYWIDHAHMSSKFARARQKLSRLGPLRYVVSVPIHSWFPPSSPIAMHSSDCRTCWRLAKSDVWFRRDWWSVRLILFHWSLTNLLWKAELRVV